jgi:hypothetical protein
MESRTFIFIFELYPSCPPNLYNKIEHLLVSDDWIKIRSTEWQKTFDKQMIEDVIEELYKELIKKLPWFWEKCNSESTYVFEASNMHLLREK